MPDQPTPPMNQAPEPSAGQNRTAGQLIDDLVISGRYTQAELAGILDRSPSLISKVRHGKKPGGNLLGALQELADSDEVTSAPERRRRKDGRTAKVRGKRGQGSVTPETAQSRFRRRHTTPEPGPAPTGSDPRDKEHSAQPEFSERRPPARNTLHYEEQQLPHGRSTATARWAPRNRDARNLAADKLLDIARGAAARGDRWQAVVWYEVNDARGRRKVKANLGGKAGYLGDNILSAVESQIADGGSFIDWLDSQCQRRAIPTTNENTGSAGSADIAAGTIVSVDIDTW